MMGFGDTLVQKHAIFLGSHVRGTEGGRGGGGGGGGGGGRS